MMQKTQLRREAYRIHLLHHIKFSTFRLATPVTILTILYVINILSHFLLIFLVQKICRLKVEIKLQAAKSVFAIGYKIFQKNYGMNYFCCVSNLRYIHQMNTYQTRQAFYWTILEHVKPLIIVPMLYHVKKQGIMFGLKAFTGAAFSQLAEKW